MGGGRPSENIAVVGWNKGRSRSGGGEGVSDPQSTGGGGGAAVWDE